MPERFAPSKSPSWDDDRTPLALLYEDKQPLIGIYETIDDARRELRSLEGFADASLITAANQGSS